MGAGSVDSNIRDILAGVKNGGARFQFSDSPNVDGNGRLRVANPVNLFLNKNIHSKNDNLWEEPIVGAVIEHGAVTNGPFQVAETITGGTSGTTGVVTAVNGGALTVTYTVNHNDFVAGETITGSVSAATAAVSTVDTGSHISHDRDTASAVLQVGAIVGDSAIRQSHRYIPYRPGKNHHITLTFLFGGTGSASVVRRTKTSGSVVNHETAQADWANDTLDGTRGDDNPSKINLDLTKVQYLIVDFQWQGVGRVRWGFELEGRVVYFHEEPFTNVDTVAFMSTPSLPVHYEIKRTAQGIERYVGYGDAENGLFLKLVDTAPSSSQMKEICSSVVSEGGERLTGLGFSESHDITPRTVGTTLTPVFAVRLKTAVTGGGDNRKTLEFRSAALFATGTGNAHYHVERIHDPSGITATWAPVGGDSEAEITKDISAIVGSPNTAIEEGYAAGGGGTSKSTGQQDIRADLQDQHHLITQNYGSDNSEVLVIYAQAFASTIDVYAVISWIEYE